MKIVKNCVLLTMAVVLVACSPSDNSATDQAETKVSQAPEPAMVADTVYTNGRIYTVNNARPWVDAVAIKDGKFLVVGSAGDVEEVTGSTTQLVDLGGKFAMPGIIDLHAHPFITPWYGSMNLKFGNPGDADAMLAEIKAYADAHPDKEWIIGGQYSLGVFPGDKPRKELLDAIVPDRPVAILDQTGHSMWLNSRAMEIAGINAETPTNSLVVIDKDPDTGEPRGAIFEQAIQLVEPHIPQAGAEEYAEVIAEILDMFASYGVTAQQTAEGHKAPLDGVRLLEEQGRLNQRLFVSWDWKTTLNLAYTLEDIEGQIRNRAQYESDLVRPNYVKIFSDGSPISTSSTLLEPYSNNPDTHGKSNMSTEEFAAAFKQFDDWGVGVHVHSMGDGTIRRVVDALEIMKRENGDSGVRHKIAHNTMITTEDLVRVAALKDVNIDFSPPIWVPHSARGAFEPPIGTERFEKIYPVRTALETPGLHVGQGSDWQTANPTPNPMLAIEGLVTRRNPADPENFPGVLNADQAITLEQAIAMSTLEGAWVLGVEGEIGSIETGKLADMIILDHNLFDIDASAIDQVQVLQTYIGGRLAYDRDRQGNEDVDASEMLDRL